MSPLKMEEQLSKLYMISMFRKFQDELKQLIQLNHNCIRNLDGLKTYEVIEIVKNNQGENKQLLFEVQFNEATEEVNCICRSFDFQGILCRHALCILQSEFVMELQDRYIMSRWSKDFKRIHSMTATNNIGIIVNIPMGYDHLYNLGLRCVQQIVEMASSFPNSYLFIANLFDEMKAKIVAHISAECEAPISQAEPDNAMVSKLLDPPVAQSKGCPKSKQKVSRCEVAANK
ncbi:Protein FAR1-RELATED SEQUENCE 12 [Acorus gramineus]|uniref:Protein FAR1-RELATED SEQUENCE n=1 Tax=Acorus gramineus TaxID=55184 RepID=A0AAV9AUH7_ACOGR|nr:Protein FAR1-RELATED SEQUENCE 12 [Acorus gramineus]